MLASRRWSCSHGEAQDFVQSNKAQVTQTRNSSGSHLPSHPTSQRPHLQLLALLLQLARALRLLLDALRRLAALVRVAPLHLLHSHHLRAEKGRYREAANAGWAAALLGHMP